MDLHIPDDLAAELHKKAAASGSDPAELAVLAIRRTISSNRRLEELLQPTREAMMAALEGSAFRPSTMVVAAALGEDAGLVGAGLAAREVVHG